MTIAALVAGGPLVVAWKASNNGERRMSITEKTRAQDYAFGISDYPCQISAQMRKVMKANAVALAEMMGSPREGAIPVRYRVTEINAS